MGQGEGLEGGEGGRQPTWSSASMRGSSPALTISVCAARLRLSFCGVRRQRTEVKHRGEEHAGESAQLCVVVVCGVVGCHGLLSFARNC